MRDTSIVYGVNGLADRDTEGARSLARTAWSFVARNRQSVQPEASRDMIQLLGASVTPSILNVALDGPDADLDRLLDLGFNGHQPLKRRVGTSGLLQHQPHSCPSKPNNVKVHECPFEPSLEMGSLDLLRGTEYRAYLDHIDQAGTFLHHHVNGAAVKATGASILRPRLNIWHLNEVACDATGHAYYLPPDNSPAAVARKRRQFLASLIAGDHLGWTNAVLENNPPLSLWQEYWDFIRGRFNWAGGVEDAHRGHTAHARYHSSMLPRPKYYREVTTIFPIPRTLPDKFPVFTGPGAGSVLADM